MNKPPRYIEGDSNWKENDTAKELTVRQAKDFGNQKRKTRPLIQTNKGNQT